MPRRDKKTALEPIYEQYKHQIDTIVHEIGGSYRQSAAVIAWLYGGTAESWRKFLPNKHTKGTPKEVKLLLEKLKKK